MPEKPLRLFIASYLDAKVRNQLDVRLQERVPEPALRWAHAEQWHLTWLFLGDTHPGKLPGIHEQLRSALAGVQPCTVIFQKLSIWPHWKRPQVLVYELDATEPLLAMAENIQEPLGYSGLTKPFKPHITLGRFRRGSRVSPACMSWLENMEQSPFLWTIQTVCLMQSTLTEPGPIHQPLAEIELC